MSFSIITDTSANLPTPWLKENGVSAVPFSYFINGREHKCIDTLLFNAKKFYTAIREGTKVTTSLISPAAYSDYFRAALENGEDVLYISMSSGISGSFQAAQLAAHGLSEEFPERRIILVDSIGASLGEGLLAMKAVEMRSAGMSIEETAAELEQMKTSMCQVFTVDDLMHLRSTGRLSNAKAVIGSVLNIKPLLKGDSAGRIVSFAKTRGRRRSIEAVADQYDRLVSDAENQTIGIAHADCMDDVVYLCGLLKRNNPPKEIMTVDYEPVTGAHVGPGALALFFFGSREFRFEKAFC